jgi:hypothetical protein
VRHSSRSSRYFSVWAVLPGGCPVPSSPAGRWYRRSIRH